MGVGGPSRGLRLGSVKGLSMAAPQLASLRNATRCKAITRRRKEREER